MTNLPAITVAMPVRNGGSLLDAAVRSIRAQSFTNWRLVLVDDGSTDGAVDRVRMLGDARIDVIADGRNMGLAHRLNQIIDAAETPYIARMDHDDIAHPDRFARQVQLLEDCPDLSLVGTKCLSLSEQGEIIGQLPYVHDHADICAKPWLGFSLPHPSWLGRTGWFKAFRYADPAPYCCEDQELLLRAYQQSRYHALAEPLLAYRVRTRTPFLKLFRTRAALTGVQARFFASENRYADLGLALGAFGVRVCADVVRQIMPTVRSDVRALSAQAPQDWENILSQSETGEQLKSSPQ